MPTFPLRGTLTLLALGFASGPAPAEVVTLNPVADTCLWELDPDYNFGRQRSLPAGAIGDMGPANGDRARALFRFEFEGALPPGALIESARLTLTRFQVRLPMDRGVSDFALSRVLVDWGEGNNLGEFPGGREADDPGEATWNNRMHPSTGWSVPGGQFGIDFAAEHSAVVNNVDANLTYHFNFNAAGLVGMQAMVDGIALNYGWVLYALDEDTLRTARHWTSRESRAGFEGPPPRLEITFSVVVLPPPPQIIEVEIDEMAQELVVWVAALAGYRYQLESGDDLASWSPGEIQDPAVDGELVYRVPMVGAALFVRIAATALPPE